MSYDVDEDDDNENNDYNSDEEDDYSSNSLNDNDFYLWLLISIVPATVLNCTNNCTLINEMGCTVDGAIDPWSCLN